MTPFHRQTQRRRRIQNRQRQLDTASATTEDSSNQSNKTQPKLEERKFCACGHSFIYDRHLIFHEKWECGRLQFCDLCGKSFNTISNLKQHKKICKI